MKNIVVALIAFTCILSFTPPVAKAAPVRYVSSSTKSWPLGIGRTRSMDTYRMRPEMAAKYLPLSLIKTGGFAELLQEVEATPNVDTTDWPSWIGDVR